MVRIVYLLIIFLLFGCNDKSRVEDTSMEISYYQEEELTEDITYVEEEEKDELSWSEIKESVKDISEKIYDKLDIDEYTDSDDLRYLYNKIKDKTEDTPLFNGCILPLIHLSKYDGERLQYKIQYPMLKKKMTLLS